MPSPEQLIWSNGVQLCTQTFGSRTDPPLLLVMGLGAQMIQWDDDFCEQLAARGFWVIRFDNRDVGRSTWLSGGRRLQVRELLAQRFFGTPVESTYTLRDMADDALGLLVALGVESAHVVGVSMGGMIAQELALAYPQRVLSLTSIMSTTGDPRLPGPTSEARRLLTAKPAKTRDEYIEQFGAMNRLLRAGRFPEDEARDPQRAERAYDRGLNPAGVGRQFRAILASGSRKERLRALAVPTLVIHGKADPLIREQGGQDTAATVPGARLVSIENMGHALTLETWPVLIDSITEHARAAAPQRVAS